MNDDLTDLLDQVVTVEPLPAWGDVLTRARRSRRRYGALAALVALFVLVPAAWAIDNAFYGSPPPPEAQSAVAFWNKYAPQAEAYAEAHGWPNPQQYGTTADLSKLHGLFQVQTPYGPLDVWGAPSSNGGLCWTMDYQADLTRAPGVMSEPGGGGGCSQPGGLANNYGIEVDSGYPSVYLTSGYTDNANAASAQETIKVGEKVLTKTGPVVDGLYAIAFPRDPTTTDAWDSANIGPEKVVTYDANGNEVETWQNPWQIPCPAVSGPCTPRTP
jgi:hypothetical protein